MLTRIIEEDIRRGTLPQGYALLPRDVGKMLAWNGFGQVQPGDVGIRVWVKSYGLVMENREQRDARLAGTVKPSTA